VTLPEGTAANLASYYPPGNQFLQIEGGLPVGAKPNTFGPHMPFPIPFPFCFISSDPVTVTECRLSLGVINATSRFANMFRNVLKAQGITVDHLVIGECTGGAGSIVFIHVVAHERAPDHFPFPNHHAAGWSTVYTHRSDPLSVLMDHCLQVRYGPSHHERRGTLFGF
jgi:hypothetical protein